MVDQAVREIPLTRGMVALVDEADVPLVSAYSWCAYPSTWTWYAVTYVGRRMVRMHRLIASAPDGSLVDHRNLNGLDNTRGNLRICTKAQNAMNSTGRRVRASQYKGVFRDKNRWRAQINSGGVKSHLGNYESEEEAGRAYDSAALRLFGQFARLNFPQEATHAS